MRFLRVARLRSIAPTTAVRHHFALDQLARLVQVVVDDRVAGRCRRVVDRRQQLGRVDRVLDRGRAGLVATCRRRSRAGRRRRRRAPCSSTASGRGRRRCSGCPRCSRRAAGCGRTRRPPRPASPSSRPRSSRSAISADSAGVEHRGRLRLHALRAGRRGRPTSGCR